MGQTGHNHIDAGAHGKQHTSFFFCFTILHKKSICVYGFGMRLLYAFIIDHIRMHKAVIGCIVLIMLTAGRVRCNTMPHMLIKASPRYVGNAEANDRVFHRIEMISRDQER